MFHLVALSLLAVSGSAWTLGQDGAGQPPQAPIVVEGRRDVDVDREVQGFLAALAPAGAREQLGRLETPVCPAAAGLGEADNEALAARMRRVAAAAGIATGGPGCAPNVFVLVAPDKSAAVRALYARDPDMFGGRSSRDVARLAADSTGPAVAWQVEGLMGSDGQTIMADIEDRSWVVGLQTRVGSPTRPGVVAAFIVVEASVLQGLSLIQLADYAALRTLIDTDPDRVRALRTPTVLGLFDSAGRPADDAPLSLTEWDLRIYGHIQRREMQRDFLADMEASAAAARRRDAGGRDER
jgi:hypothetical protein